MTDVYEAILNELEARNVAYARKFPPYYISSLGCHIFNIMNQQKGIYTEAGLKVNTRQHIILVTVPGFGKSFWLRQFLENELSLVKGTKVGCTFESQMSEAGFVGTAKFNSEGVAQESPGLCRNESNSIVGIEEFSAISAAVSQNYNAGLDTALLTALDSGMVRKRLAAGKIEYQTNLSLWTGVQPARYELSSGLARRFLFLLLIPNFNDIKQFKLNRRSSKNVKTNTLTLSKLKAAINTRYDDIMKKLEKVEFDRTIYKKLDELDVVHYEEPLYERIALGYWLMKVKEMPKTLTIKMDPTLDALFDNEKGDRFKIKRGTQLAQVWALVQDVGRISELKLKNHLLDFGMDWQDASDLIMTLIKLKWVKKEVNGDIVAIRDKK
tara:strand:- start:27774 stop:28919 length:1146 start_codon:yes stop_codon:yes gene_type:complete